MVITCLSTEIVGVCGFRLSRQVGVFWDGMFVLRKQQGSLAPISSIFGVKPAPLFLSNYQCMPNFFILFF
jgi:hypothetical protein